MLVSVLSLSSSVKANDEGQMLLGDENLVSNKLTRVQFPMKLRFEALADVCEVSFFSFTSNDNIFILVNLFNMLNFDLSLVSL